VAKIGDRLEGHSSCVLRRKFPSPRPRLATLWKRGYFTESIGHVLVATIECDIAEQLGE
jgi:REP element-mobilizing transposase RayT